MGGHMPNKIRRSIFSVNSKYQWQILAVSIVPVVLGYLLLAGFLHSLTSQISYHIVNGIPYDDLMIQIPQLIIKFDLILIGSCIIFGILVLVTLQDLIGPFDRINRELDDIIAGRSKKTIGVRPRDQIAKTLLKRVNVLIESYVGQTK
jgi:hypothetical protein